MKLENVQRVNRVNEYKRMGILKKIEEKDQRIEKCLPVKKSLIDDRRRAGAKDENSEGEDRCGDGGGPY